MGGTGKIVDGVTKGIVSSTKGLLNLVGIGDTPAPEPEEEIVEPEEVEVPTTEERAQVTTDAATKAKLRKQVKTGRSSTILTSPLGTTTSANIGTKTLLGE